MKDMTRLPKILKALSREPRPLLKDLAEEFGVSNAYVSKVGRANGMRRMVDRTKFQKVTFNMDKEDYVLLKDLFGLGYSVQIRDWIHERCQQVRKNAQQVLEDTE